MSNISGGRSPFNGLGYKGSLKSTQYFIPAFTSSCIRGGVAEWLRRSVWNHARSTRVGSNPVVGITNHKPTANSGVHPSEVGK